MGAPFIRVFLLFLALIFAPDLRSAPPTLTANLDATGSILRLELSGTIGRSYAIESSTNLNQWLPVFAGLLETGTVSTQISLATAGPKHFFRGREDSGGNFPTNVVLAANTNLSVTMIVTTNGGSAVLYAADGTEFSFAVPPFTLPEPQLITMTLVTNVGGLPFSGGLLGAVRIEPEGLDFWGAASLRISLRAEVDRRKVVSFGANNDGSEFFLTPDRVTTNGVVIPITQLGVFGSALAESSEVSAAGTLVWDSLDEIQTDTDEEQLGSSTANLNDCYPDRTEAARLIARNLNRNMRSMSQEIASRLAEARQNQLQGVVEDTFDASEILAEGEDANCRFLQNQIQPYLTESTGNCELMKVLLVKVLGIERQRQLLGAEPNPACSSALSDFPLCAGLQNCLQEIEICCLGGRKGPSKVAEIYGLARQDQLLGTGCLSTSAIDQAVEACSSNAWTGRLTFSAHGENIEEFSDGRITQITIDRYNSHFSGDVWESQEVIFPGFGGTATLRLRGRISYDEFYNQTTTISDDCGGSRTVDESRTVAATETWYRVDLNLNANGSYSILAAHFDNSTGVPGAEARDTDSFFHSSGRRVFTGQGSECVTTVESTTRTDRTIVLLPPLAVFNLPMSSTNSVSGSSTIEEFIDNPPTDGEYNWSFTRQRTE